MLAVPALTITARDAGSRARAGVLRTAHGEVRTPAFVPLATKATVKGMLPAEVAALGYDIVLGNTFHLFLDPGHERIARFGGLHEFMGWSGPIVTDSGGFQVFSMGHGTVADEIKGRTPHGGERQGGIIAIEERGVRFRSYLDGSERFMAPETSMEIQAALGSDLALVFDECTPFNVPRDYTARSTERTHRWLRRCLDWHHEHGPDGQLVYGIVQGGVFEDLRARVRAGGRRQRVRRHRDRRLAGRRQGRDAQGRRLDDGRAAGGPPAPPARHRRDRRPRARRRAGHRHLRLRDADAARAATAWSLVPDPERRWRVDLSQARWKDSDEPLMEGCPCPACALGLTRGYLRYLAHARELTGMRLFTLHNLAFVERVMRRLREAIGAGTLAAEAAALRAGAAP